MQKIHTQLPLVGLADWLVGDQNPPENDAHPVETANSEAGQGIKTSVVKIASNKAWWARLTPAERTEVHRRYRANLLARNPDHDKEAYLKYRETHKRCHREWKEKNWDRMLAYGRQCYERNREKVAQRRKEIREADPERLRGYERKWSAENREAKRAAGRTAYYRMKQDPEKMAAYRERCRKKNATEKRKAYARTWVKRKRAENPAYRIHKAMMGRISEYMGYQQKRTGRSLKLIGCTVLELKQHIEQQWLPSMSWENYGNKTGQWNIDHIIPCASFDLRDPEQAKACFNWTNLRPLWHSENIAKSSNHNGRHWRHADHELPACPVAPEPSH